MFFSLPPQLICKLNTRRKEEKEVHNNTNKHENFSWIFFFDIAGFPLIIFSNEMWHLMEDIRSIFWLAFISNEKRSFFSGWNRQKSEFEGSDYLCLILFNSHFHRKFPDDDEVCFLCRNFNWWFSCESLTKNSVIFLYLPHLLFKYWFGLVRFSLSKVQHIVFGVKIISHWAIKKKSS